MIFRSVIPWTIVNALKAFGLRATGAYLVDRKCYRLPADGACSGRPVRRQPAGRSSFPFIMMKAKLGYEAPEADGSSRSSAKQRRPRSRKSTAHNQSNFDASTKLAKALALCVKGNTTR
jgi:hypothetical protein